MPKVSIGLPVYNGENYVRFAIESVLAQTFEDWELVISDNASTDATVQICESYAQSDSRIRFLPAEENQGAAWNFNRVFENATGEYFRWLSHDDVLMPRTIEVCSAILDTSPDVLLCATRTGAIDQDGYRILDADGSADLACQGLTEAGERKRRESTSSPRASERYRGVLMHSLRCNEVYGLVRREVMRTTQLHPSYCGGEKVLLAELALLGKFYEVPETLFFVRWHDHRFTANNSTVEQDRHMATKTRRVLRLPHQFRATLGYMQLVAKVPLPFNERLRCFCICTRFVLQCSKWIGILRNTVAGKSTSATIEGATQRGPKIAATGGFVAPQVPPLRKPEDGSGLQSVSGPM